MHPPGTASRGDLVANPTFPWLSLPLGDASKGGREPRFSPPQRGGDGLARTGRGQRGHTPDSKIRDQRHPRTDRAPTHPARDTTAPKRLAAPVPPPPLPLRGISPAPKGGRDDQEGRPRPEGERESGSSAFVGARKVGRGARLHVFFSPVAGGDGSGRSGRSQRGTLNL